MYPRSYFYVAKMMDALEEECENNSAVSGNIVISFARQQRLGTGACQSGHFTREEGGGRDAGAHQSGKCNHTA